MKSLPLALLLPLVVAVACGDDGGKDNPASGGSGSGTDGTTAPDDTAEPGLVHESGFTLTRDDHASRTNLTATAAYAVEVNESGVSGFINYAEVDDSGAETCSAVLQLRTVFPEPDPHTDTASPELADAPPCTDCDYGHFVQSDLSDVSGSCRFFSPVLALDHAPSFLPGFSNLVFAIYDDGASLVVRQTTSDGDSSELALLDDGTATFRGGVLSGSNTAAEEVVNYWDRSCVDGGMFTQYFTMTPGELALSDTLTCPDGTSDGTLVYDTWERSLTHGETLSVALRSSDQSLLLYIVAPNECLTQMMELPQSCDGAGSAYCHSIELLAQEGGPYRAVVEGPCSTAGVVYEFDARVF